MPITSVMAGCQAENGHFTRAASSKPCRAAFWMPGQDATIECFMGNSLSQFSWKKCWRWLFSFLSVTFSFIRGMPCSAQTLPGGSRVTFGLINPLLVVQSLPRSCQSETLSPSWNLGWQPSCLELDKALAATRRLLLGLLWFFSNVDEM